MIVVSILEDKIRAAVGRAGSRPFVEGLFSVSYDRTSPTGWQEALEELWKKERLPRKGITLVLPREKTVTRVIALPNMPPRQLSGVVSQEMRLTGEEELVTDYMPLSGDGAMRDCLAVSCRKSVLEDYVRGFEALGLGLKQITVPMASQLKLLAAAEEMQDKTCLWLVFEGSGVTTILAEKGAYGYAGGGRLQAMDDREVFGREVEKIVSGTMQFQERKRRGSAITHVYFAGCTEEELEACRPGLECLGVRGQMLPGCGRFRSFPKGEQLGDWISCAGAFLRLEMRRKELDLYSAYRRDLRIRRRKLPVYLPALLVLLAGLGMFGLLRVQNQALEEELSALRRELALEETQYWQAEKRWLYNEGLMERLELMNEMEKSRATYPAVTGPLIKELAAVGGEEIGMVLEGYDAGTGVLSFRARSRRVISIPDYVSALRATGRFELLEYSGYRCEEDMYVLSLRCILKGNGEGGAS